MRQGYIGKVVDRSVAVDERYREVLLCHTYRQIYQSTNALKVNIDSMQESVLPALSPVYRISPGIYDNRVVFSGVIENML